MKLKKFWSVGGRAPGASPLNPPLGFARDITPLPTYYNVVILNELSLMTFSVSEVKICEALYVIIQTYCNILLQHVQHLEEFRQRRPTVPTAAYMF